MKALIIEDEAPLAERLRALLTSLRPDWEILGPAADTRSATSEIRSHPDLDLIFADIRLEDGYSFEVFDAVSTDALIVFTTAYDEYALRAFDYNCIDYLLKPFGKQDLQDALDKIERRAVRTDVKQARAAAAQIGSGRPLYRKRLEMNRGDSTVIIEVDDLVYAEYDLGMVRLWCRDGASGVAGHSLTALQEELDPDVFMRVSRNELVRFSEVGRIRATLGRNKILNLKPPFDQKEIIITAPVVRALRERLSKQE